MRMLVFARRTSREILRDPVNLAFGLGFPLVLLGLLTAIQANIPVSLFELPHLTPGITVFGLSFLSLFSAVLMAKDRESAFLQRLYTTPMRSWDFLLGYLLPLLPMAIGQTLLCYLAAMAMGMEFSWNILCSVLMSLPVSSVFIGLGLLCGSVLGSKQVGGICGALLTNLTAFLSGIWFDVEMVGGFFKKLADCLPFLHAVELQRCVLQGDWNGAQAHLIWVLSYGLGILALAVTFFLAQRKRQ